MKFILRFLILLTGLFTATIKTKKRPVTGTLS
jgi:hypothetical protein